MRVPQICTFRLAAASVFGVVLNAGFISTHGFLMKSQCSVSLQSSLAVDLKGGFLEDLFGNGQSQSEKELSKKLSTPPPATDKVDDQEDDSLSLAAFQQEVNKRTAPPQQESDDEEEVFDGYVMRDIIVEKWGHAFDLEFQPVEALGFKQIYLNVMPFRLGSKRFRHETELDYLCHLQAIVDILLKYNQVGNVLYQIDATNKKPRAGTSPLVAVPLKLDLTPEQVDKILGP